MLFTHTIEILGQLHNSAKRPLNSRVVTQGYTYAACLVATASAKTVTLAKQERATILAQIIELTRDLAETNDKSRPGLMRIQELTLKIRMLQKEGDRLRKVLPKVGDQAVVIWKRSVETAQEDVVLKKGRVPEYLHQGYILEIRTDFEVTSKPVQSKRAA